MWSEKWWVQEDYHVHHVHPSPGCAPAPAVTDAAGLHCCQSSRSLLLLGLQCPDWTNTRALYSQAQNLVLAKAELHVAHSSSFPRSCCTWTYWWVPPVWSHLQTSWEVPSRSLILAGQATGRTFVVFHIVTGVQVNYSLLTAASEPSHATGFYLWWLLIWAVMLFLL